MVVEKCLTLRSFFCDPSLHRQVFSQSGSLSRKLHFLFAPMLRRPEMAALAEAVHNGNHPDSSDLLLFRKKGPDEGPLVIVANLQRKEKVASGRSVSLKQTAP